MAYGGAITGDEDVIISPLWLILCLLISHNLLLKKKKIIFSIFFFCVIFNLA